MGLLRLFGNGEQELVLSGPDTVSAKGVVVRVVGCRCCNAQGKEIRMGKASKGFAMKKKGDTEAKVFRHVPERAERQAA